MKQAWKKKLLGFAVSLKTGLNSASESLGFFGKKNVILGCVTYSNVTLKVHLQWGQWKAYLT